MFGRKKEKIHQDPLVKENSPALQQSVATEDKYKKLEEESLHTGDQFPSTPAGMDIVNQLMTLIRESIERSSDLSIWVVIDGGTINEKGWQINGVLSYAAFLVYILGSKETTVPNGEKSLFRLSSQKQTNGFLKVDNQSLVETEYPPYNNCRNNILRRVQELFIQYYNWCEPKTFSGILLREFSYPNKWTGTCRAIGFSISKEKFLQKLSQKMFNSEAIVSLRDLILGIIRESIDSHKSGMVFRMICEVQINANSMVFRYEFSCNGIDCDKNSSHVSFEDLSIPSLQSTMEQSAAALSLVSLIQVELMTLYSNWQPTVKLLPGNDENCERIVFSYHFKDLGQTKGWG